VFARPATSTAAGAAGASNTFTGANGHHPTIRHYHVGCLDGQQHGSHSPPTATMRDPIRLPRATATATPKGTAVDRQSVRAGA
jgi:hypothetical protein